MPSTASPSSAQEFVFKLGSIHDGTGFALADSAQMAATGRKTWKALKGKSEAVWPAFIEASLIEALERYRPEESAGTMLVGRFPRRNRFISDYIFKVTGKRRTPKQVGSRLQQLRETSRDPHIVELLQKRDFTAEPDVQYQDDSNRQSPSISSPASTSISDTDEASVTHLSSPVELGINLTATTSTFDAPQGRIVINFLLDGPWMVVETSTEAFSLVLFDIVSSPSDSLAQPLRPASSKLVSKENPQFIFESLSHLKLNERLYCVFHVFLGDTMIHTETTPVTFPQQAVQGSLYSAHLLPEYWTTICMAQSKASRYTILQEVRRTSADTRVADAALFTVHYDFYCSTTITDPPPHDIPYCPDDPPNYPQPTQFPSPITSDYQTAHPAASRLYTWPRDVGLPCPNSPNQLNYDSQPYNHEYQSSNLYFAPAVLEFNYDYSKIPLGWSMYDGGYPPQWPDYYYGA